MVDNSEEVASRVRSLEQTLLFIVFLGSVGVGSYLIDPGTVLVGKLWLEFALVFGLVFLLNMAAEYAGPTVRALRDWRAA